MPGVTAGAILLNEDNKILLTMRNINPFKDFWCLPGGHVEEFETAKEAVIREVKEETNLDFLPDFLIYQDEIIMDKGIHNLVLFFYGTVSNTLIINPDEVSESKWFSINEALKQNLAFNHKEVLEFYHEFRK